MISQSQLLQMQARTGKKIEVSKSGVSKESDLHDQIIEYCKTQDLAWYHVHSRMDQRATNSVGTPDFILAASNGRTFWVECKRAKGKLSPAQAATLHWLKALGHKAAVVTSLEEFKAFIA